MEKQEIEKILWEELEGLFSRGKFGQTDTQLARKWLDKFASMCMEAENAGS